MPIPNIRPGDLIDANQLIIYFRELEDRIHRLEIAGPPPTPLPTQGQVVITRLVPATEIRIGEELRILGSEFFFSRGAARVLLNGTERNIKNTSSDTELRIDIPPATPLGPATVRVTNSFTAAERAINILAAVTPLLGNVRVTFLGVTPTQINIASAAPVRHTFLYELTSLGMSRPATYTVDPVISVPEWDDSATIVNEAGATRSNRFPLDPNQTVRFGVMVPLQSGAGRPSTFTTRIDVTAEDRIWNLADGSFRNGETVLPADPGVRLGTPRTTPPGNFNDATNTITGPARLLGQVDFTLPGTYTLIAGPVDSTTFASHLWSASLGTTEQSVDVTDALIRAGGGQHSTPISILFTPQPLATPIDIEVGYRTATTKTVDRFRLTPPTT